LCVKNSIEKGCFSASNTSFLGQRYDEEKCEDRYEFQDKKVNKKTGRKWPVN